MADSSTNNGTGRAGQAGVNDGTDEFNAINFMIEQALGRISTMKIVKIMAVNNSGAVAAAGFVDVMPLTNQIDGVGNSIPHATIFNVPYVRLQGGKNAFIIDPVVGDIGIMICADRDASAVKANKAQANPGSKRRFSLADGFYIGGCLNGVPEQYFRFYDDGFEAVDKHGNKITSSASGVAIAAQGTLALSGTHVTINGKDFALHTHTGGTLSGNTGPVIP